MFALVVLALGASIVLGPRLVFFGFGEEERIAREAGISALRLAGLVAAIAFGVARERDRALFQTLLARPVTPAGVVLGRYLGALVVAVMALSMLSAVHYGTLKANFGDGPGAAAAAGAGAALGRAVLEAAVLVGLAVAASGLLARGVAAVAVLLVFALAHSNDKLTALVPSDGGVLAAGLAALAYVALGAAVAETREAGA
jgi:hypothetical protein